VRDAFRFLARSGGGTGVHLILKRLDSPIIEVRGDDNRSTTYAA